MKSIMESGLMYVLCGCIIAACVVINILIYRKKK